MPLAAPGDCAPLAFCVLYMRLIRVSCGAYLLCSQFWHRLPLRGTVLCAYIVFAALVSCASACACTCTVSVCVSRSWRLLSAFGVTVCWDATTVFALKRHGQYVAPFCPGCSFHEELRSQNAPTLIVRRHGTCLSAAWRSLCFLCLGSPLWLCVACAYLQLSIDPLRRLLVLAGQHAFECPALRNLIVKLVHFAGLC